MNGILLLLLLVTIISFCISTIRYIVYRQNITNTIKAFNKRENDHANPPPLVNLDSWISDNSDKLSRKLPENENWCKELVLEITNESDCNELGGRLCENIKYSRVDIPADMDTTFYTSNGTMLLPGHSYCIHREPPITQSQYHCDNTWGFWVYSAKYERWMCQSRVPGIYNAATNQFENACGKHGQLLFDGKPIRIDFNSDFKPRDFYSQEFQNRFSCQCPKGYIFDGERSRTTCFRDPCLKELPPYASATGYVDGGKCECGPHFFNIGGNESFPCTACPSNVPLYDEKTNILTIFVKCNEFGVMKCDTEEEKITGCKKIYIKVKGLKEPVESFEDRIFF